MQGDKGIEMIKELWGKVNEMVQKISVRWNHYYNRNWSGTNRGFYSMTMLLLSIVIGLLATNFFRSAKLAFIIGVVITLILGTLLIKLLSIIIKALFKIDIQTWIYLCALTYTIINLAITGGSGSVTMSPVIISIIMILAFVAFSRGIWALCKNKVHTPTILITVGISGCIMIAAFILIGSKGFEDTYISSYLELNTQEQESTEIAGMENIQKNGEYTVESLEYSPYKEVDMVSGTVDLSMYVQAASGLNGIYREMVQNYSVDAAPIAGTIWYPLEANNCPVLFFIHGNHSIRTDSYLGYEYLGEYLASHGYVVVSVDENVLNELSGENDARAILLLENIKQVQKFNKDKSNALYGKINYEKIAIGGHSRGGEAVATAYLFNDYDCYPENGARKFNYHFNIQSILAVAPTANQYRPADHDVKISDVNYLLLQGANDQDVAVFMGTTQYQNVTFTGEGKYIKSSLYIAGANHGQFNSEWGLYDLSDPYNLFSNVANFISQEDQQSILKTYAKVFLDTTLGEDDTYRDLLTNYAKYKKYLPETVYVQQYQNSDFSCISNFEEDSDIETATMKGASISAKNTSIWTEKKLTFSNLQVKSERKNNALALKWSKTLDAEVIFQMNAQDVGSKSIQFDICNMNESKVKEKNYETLDATVILTDQAGNTASASIAETTTIYPTLPIKLGKTQYLFDENEYKHQLQTVSIPSKAFISKSEDFDKENVVKITIAFNKQNSGNIMIDNIGLE